MDERMQSFAWMTVFIIIFVYVPGSTFNETENIETNRNQTNTLQIFPFPNKNATTNYNNNSQLTNNSPLVALANAIGLQEISAKYQISSNNEFIFAANNIRSRSINSYTGNANNSDRSLALTTMTTLPRAKPLQKPKRFTNENVTQQVTLPLPLPLPLSTTSLTPSSMMASLVPTGTTTATINFDMEATTNILSNNEVSGAEAGGEANVFIAPAKESPSKFATASMMYIYSSTPASLLPSSPSSSSSSSSSSSPFSTSSEVSTQFPLRTTSTPKPPVVDKYQNITSQAGTHAYLPCNVKHFIKKPISWLRVRDGHILTVDQTTFIADQRFQSIYTANPERWSLQIKYVQTKDAGTYECQVSTEPKSSAIVRLKVVEPKTELLGESSRHVKAGSQVTLRCIISQALEPPLFINWFYNSKQIYLHNRKGWRTEIERIDEPKAATATATVSTSATQHQQSSGLTMSASDVNATEVESFEFRHTTTASLIIPSVGKQDSGNYTCSPSNSEPMTVALHVLNGEYSASAITSGMESNMVNGNSDSQWQRNKIAILILLWVISFFLSMKISTKKDIRKTRTRNTIAMNTNGRNRDGSRQRHRHRHGQKDNKFSLNTLSTRSDTRTTPMLH